MYKNPTDNNADNIHYELPKRTLFKLEKDNLSSCFAICTKLESKNMNPLLLAFNHLSHQVIVQLASSVLSPIPLISFSLLCRLVPAIKLNQRCQITTK